MEFSGPNGISQKFRGNYISLQTLTLRIDSTAQIAQFYPTALPQAKIANTPAQVSHAGAERCAAPRASPLAPPFAFAGLFARGVSQDRPSQMATRQVLVRRNTARMFHNMQTHDSNIQHNMIQHTASKPRWTKCDPRLQRSASFRGCPWPLCRGLSRGRVPESQSRTLRRRLDRLHYAARVRSTRAQANPLSLLWNLLHRSSFFDPAKATVSPSSRVESSSFIPSPGDRNLSESLLAHDRSASPRVYPCSLSLSLSLLTLFRSRVCLFVCLLSRSLSLALSFRKAAAICLGLGYPAQTHQAPQVHLRDHRQPRIRVYWGRGIPDMLDTTCRTPQQLPPPQLVVM